VEDANLNSGAKHKGGKSVRLKRNLEVGQRDLNNNKRRGWGERKRGSGFQSTKKNSGGKARAGFS